MVHEEIVASRWLEGRSDNGGAVVPDHAVLKDAMQERNGERGRADVESAVRSNVEDGTDSGLECSAEKWVRGVCGMIFEGTR